MKNVREVMKRKRSRREKTKDERVEQIFRELQERGWIDEISKEVIK